MQMRKNGFSLLGRIKIGLWSNGKKGHVVWWVQIYPVPEWWAHQGQKRGWWSDAPIMPNAQRTSQWGQCYNLGWLQLVRSWFSDENEVSWLPGYIEGPGFFKEIPRWQCHNSLGSNCERLFQGAWDIILTHGLATTESRLNPIENLWDVLEKTLRSDPALPSSAQDLAKKCLQIWMGLNVVTSLSKWNIGVCHFFLEPGSVWTIILLKSSH